MIFYHFALFLVLQRSQASLCFPALVWPTAKISWEGAMLYLGVKGRGSWNCKWSAPCLVVAQSPKRPHMIVIERTADDNLHF